MILSITALHRAFNLRMKTYSRLHHSRMHSDPQGLSTFCNGAEMSATASVGPAEGMSNDKGGGTYRLGAAVQRAMAMRERHSSSCKLEDIKGIGGMRDVYMSWLAHSPSLSCNATSGYFAEVTEDEIFCSAIGAQSMKYTRFCPDVDGLNQEFGHISNGKRELELGGNCSCDGDLSKNQAVMKKSFVTRLCRQLFGRRKKSSSNA
ncbi:hypothetical protein SUGI_1194540 [Cryptomeria japonica]|nr:hypothetical protein SUGI_1194540 [Cryptomeria japonica]